MAKCETCGFLALRRKSDDALVEANDNYRKTGYTGHYPDLTHPLHLLPLCFARACNLQAELGWGTFSESQAHSAFDAQTTAAAFGYPNQVLSVLGNDRPQCEGKWVHWEQGFTPKEHREMLDRKEMLKWQKEREESDRAFQEKEAAENRKWRFREFVVAVIGVIVLIVITMTAAFVQRGEQPIINPTFSPTINVPPSQIIVQQTQPSTSGTGAPQP